MTALLGALPRGVQPVAMSDAGGSYGWRCLRAGCTARGNRRGWDEAVSDALTHQDGHEQQETTP